MSTDSQYLAVDRFEDGIAILVADSGEVIEVPKSVLPRGISPGAVIKVVRHLDGDFAWDRAEIDEAERASRIAKAEDVLKELRERDPGGDIAL